MIGPNQGVKSPYIKKTMQSIYKVENTVTCYKKIDQIRMPTGRETFAHKDECG